MSLILTYNIAYLGSKQKDLLPGLLVGGYINVPDIGLNEFIQDP